MLGLNSILNACMNAPGELVLIREELSLLANDLWYRTWGHYKVAVG